MLVDTIKDPQRQVAHIQEQLQDQFAQVKEELGQKLELDTWLTSSKSDSRQMMEQLAQLSEQVAALHEKIDSISQK
jgi:peptidoglycan hydrolase CwlO-like protein